MGRVPRVYVAGHRGMVGSALVGRLEAERNVQILTRSHRELDLTRQDQTEAFLRDEKPDLIYLAAARVGGIMANSTRPAEFIYDNLAIALNVIHGSWKAGIQRIVNLGSSCIYPREAPQPMKEEYLLTGPLETTNEAYALAKIAAIKLCRHYNTQYGTDYISLMPCNLYGRRDNYDLNGSHVLPALIRKFSLAQWLREGNHEAVQKDLALRPLPCGEIRAGQEEEKLAEYGIRSDRITLWGTGTPLREFLHADDLADAAVHFSRPGLPKQPDGLVNVGAGNELSIRELAEMIRRITGFEGAICWDSTKPDGTPRKLMDSSRARALGWSPRISLEGGVALTVEEYRNSICPDNTERHPS